MVNVRPKEFLEHCYTLESYRVNIRNPKLDQDLYELLWDRSMIGLAIVGAGGEWIEVNDKLCNLLEYTQSELQKMKFQNVTHPQDIDADVEQVQKVQAGLLKNYEMTKRYITKSGKVIMIRLRVDPVFDRETDKFKYFLSQISDPIQVGAIMPTKQVVIEPGIKGVFKRNWWWITVICGAFGPTLTFFIYQYAVFHQMQYRMQVMEELIKKIAS